MLRSFRLSSLQISATKLCVCVYIYIYISHPHTWHMVSLSHYPRFDRSGSNWWEPQTIQLLVARFFPVSCPFLLLTPTRLPVERSQLWSSEWMRWTLTEFAQVGRTFTIQQIISKNLVFVDDYWYVFYIQGRFQGLTPYVSVMVCPLLANVS